MMNDALWVMLAKRHLKLSGDEAVAAWAFSELERGVESPSLLILAGLSPPFSSWETEPYLKRSVDELGLQLPSKEAALWWYAHRIAQEIIDHPDQSTPNLESRVHLLSSVCAELHFPPLLNTLFGHDDFAPTGAAGHYFTEEQWRAAVIAAAGKLRQSGAGGISSLD